MFLILSTSLLRLLDIIFINYDLELYNLNSFFHFRWTCIIAGRISWKFCAILDMSIVDLAAIHYNAQLIGDLHQNCDSVNP